MPEPTANEKQVGGDHYKAGAGLCPYCGNELQHWDIVVMFDLGYFIGNATKYLFRFRRKAGLQDLDKAQHYIEKEKEVFKAEHAQPKDAQSTPAK